MGIYSTPFCIVPGDQANQYGAAEHRSNCALATAQTVNEAVGAGDNTKVLDLTNAIELKWTLPYAIPDDRTQADITCYVEQNTAGHSNNDAGEFYANDPMRIHQSSMIAAGWGAGNCFYLGVLGDTNTINAAVAGSAGHHKFRCRDIGALASGANLQLAFQFSLSNVGKLMPMGAAGTAANGIVGLIAKSLSCQL